MDREEWYGLGCTDESMKEETGQELEVCVQYVS